MSAKFTQGEWSVEYDGSIVMNGQIVSGAIGIDGSTQEEKKANSMLISAAPELLESVNLLSAALAPIAAATRDENLTAKIAIARAAIAKATGGAQ